MNNVDKLITTRDEVPFTQISNEVLQKLRNGDALALYCHMASRSSNWVFHKSQLKLHFGWGRDKFEKALNCLKNANLVRAICIKNDKGQYEYWHLHINSSAQFDEKYEEEKLSTIQATENPYTGENRVSKTSVRKTSNWFQPTIKKENTNKEEAKKKERRSLIFEATEKQKQKAAFQGIDLVREMDSFVSIKKRVPQSEDEFDRWLDIAIDYKNKRNLAQNTETRCTVPEYGPGHPTWEAMNSWNKQNKVSISHGSEVQRNNTGRRNM